jgi:hypothetical protein
LSEAADALAVKPVAMLATAAAALRQTNLLQCKVKFLSGRVKAALSTRP